MKDAPEKIYICPSELAGIDYDEEWLEYPLGDSIEYIRTDVFVEKVCKWLKENKDHPFIKCEDPCLSGYLTDEFIENFKQTMER